MLYIVPQDVLDHAWSYLDTADLARLDIVSRVSESVWTVAVRRRCGPLWPAGRAGVLRLYTAVHSMPARTGHFASHICAGTHVACAVGMSGIRMWGTRGTTCDWGRWCYCACTVGNTEVAVAGEYGLFLVAQGVQVWPGAVLSVACLHDGSIWFCTPDQRAYCYRDGRVTDIECPNVLCVSGPWGLAGTTSGTYPVQSWPMPCCGIVQSATLACAWFMDGRMCTFKNGHVLHIFDTGVRTIVSPFSMIGDVVCIDGTAWRDGQRYRQCPRAERVCTADGQITVVKLASSITGVT